jgi:hypothetical protein
MVLLGVAMRADRALHYRLSVQSTYRVERVHKRLSYCPCKAAADEASRETQHAGLCRGVGVVGAVRLAQRRELLGV